MSQDSNDNNQRRPNDNGNKRRRRGKGRRGRGGQRGARDKRVGNNKQRSDVSEREIEAKDKARGIYEQKPIPLGFPEGLEVPEGKQTIDWDVSPVSKRVEREACGLVMIPGEWGFLEDEMVDEIADRLRGKGITLEQGLSLRKALMQEKTVFGHHRMMSRANTFHKRYENGETVLQLSKRFDYPPVAIFRAILTARGWSKSKIKDGLREPKKRLSKRDQKEFRKAEEKDRVTNVDQGDTAVRADIFEEVVALYLDNLGIKYRRQEDLLREQKKEHGRPVNTPDFLFLERIEINGTPVAWIDAKNFYGANLSFNKKKMKKQMNRYIDEWGSGAIVFRHGFCSGLKVDGVEMLDATPLDLTMLLESEDETKLT